MPESKDSEKGDGPKYDAAFMRDLPAAAQDRIIRTVYALAELELTKQYGLPAGSLGPMLPDPVKGGLDLPEWVDKAELLAMDATSPLFGITDEEELFALSQEQTEKEEADGQEQD